VKVDRNWVVYLVRCADHSLYCGITNDLGKRLQLHNRGTGAKYTRSRRPVKLLAASGGISKSEALKLEYRIKQSPADKKLSVLEQAKDHMERGTLQTRQRIRNELQSIVKSIQQLIASVGNIVAALENLNREK
jgi:putative endonuclease